MPISKSAKKSLRVNRRQTATNRVRKARIKSALKNVTPKTLPQAVSLIDKAVKWHLFSQNKANRLKSHLSTTIKAEPGVGRATKGDTVKVKKVVKSAAKPTTKSTKTKTAKKPVAKSSKAKA